MCARAGGWPWEKLVFFAVIREPGVVVLTPDGRFRALGLAGADVEEAELVPDQAADVGLEGVEIIVAAISMQAHAFCHPYCCADEDRMGSGNLFSAEGHLYLFSIDLYGTVQSPS